MRNAVIGGGVAGAELVRTALPGPVDITLIEPKKRLELQAPFPEYLAGLTGIQDLSAPLEPFCDCVNAAFLNERAFR